MNLMNMHNLKHSRPKNIWIFMTMTQSIILNTYRKQQEIPVFYREGLASCCSDSTAGSCKPPGSVCVHFPMFCWILPTLTWRMAAVEGSWNQRRTSSVRAAGFQMNCMRCPPAWCRGDFPTSGGIQLKTSNIRWKRGEVRGLALGKNHGRSKFTSKHKQIAHLIIFVPKETGIQDL